MAASNMNPQLVTAGGAQDEAGEPTAGAALQACRRPNIYTQYDAHIEMVVVQPPHRCLMHAIIRNGALGCRPRGAGAHRCRFRRGLSGGPFVRGPLHIRHCPNNFESLLCAALRWARARLRRDAVPSGTAAVCNDERKGHLLHRTKNLDARYVIGNVSPFVLHKTVRN